MTTTDPRQEHLRQLAILVLQRLQIDDIEYGGIGLDPKRPFGNSDAEGDMLHLLGMEPECDDGYERCFSSGQREYVSGLYSEIPDYLRRVVVPLLEDPHA